MPKTKENNNSEPIEKLLWKSADKLRKNIDAAEYKHVVLGLIFLKYISDAFEDLYSKLKSGKGEYAGADPEDKDEYKAENVFFVPEIARWSYLQSKAKLPAIGKEVDNAMDAIEKENPSLKSRQNWRRIGWGTLPSSLIWKANAFWLTRFSAMPRPCLLLCGATALPRWNVRNCRPLTMF